MGEGGISEMKTVLVGKSKCGCVVESTLVDEGKHIYSIQQCSLHKAAKKLLLALKAARNHLDHCGYGDKWERECACSSNLDEKIESAIANATK